MDKLLPVSIIIPAHNEEETIENCLGSLKFSWNKIAEKYGKLIKEL